MSIYRGAGGSGDAVNDASSEVLLAVQAKDAAIAAQVAAEAAQTAAQLAETNAETAETNAETAETNAETAETNAETAATNAANSASAASTSATNAANSASTATTQATNASNSASSASTSASNASGSASTATTQATNAANSATASANSATAAQAAQTAAEAAFDAFDDIYLGAKASNPTLDNDGNALTTGDQYFNTVSNELRIWNGSSWQAASTVGGTVSSLTVTGAFAANGSTTIGDAAGDSVTINASTISTPNGLTVNGTVIPTSKTIVVTTDIGSTVQAYDADLAAFALKTAPTGDVVGTSDSQTLTNKTIALGSNTVSGTLAQFNTAVTDADLVSIAGTETLTNKTLTSPTINTATISGGTINNSAIGGTTAAAGAFTTLSASSTATLNTLSSSGATITGGTINGTTIGATTASTGKFTAVTNSALTSGRVTYAGTAGVLQDDADFTFNGTTVTMANDASISGLTVGKGGGALGTNTSVGSNALAGSNSGTADNTAVGYQALLSNTTGYYNVAVGRNALALNTTGTQLTAVGRTALASNTTGANNTAVGQDSLSANTTGSQNTAVGTGSLSSNTTASNNTAVGYQAGYSNTTGTNNCAVGRFSLRNCTTGTENTAFGTDSGDAITTGTDNTLIGYGAGYLMTTGSKNTVVGAYSGNQGGLDIRTASNYIVLSDGDGNPRQIIDNSGAVIIGATAKISSETLSVVTTGASSPAAIFKSSSSTGDYTTVNWNSATSGNNQFLAFYTEASPTLRGSITYNRGSNVTAYNTTSDQRLKENIVDAPSALAKIDSVKIRSFDWKETGNHADFGVIAQELIESAPECVTKGDDGSEIKQIWQVDTSALVPAMIKAIQELKAEVDSLKQQLGK